MEKDHRTGDRRRLGVYQKGLEFRGIGGTRRDKGEVAHEMIDDSFWH
jgi:hypothetical protein